MKSKIISIVGIVGIPASYGGFETLVDNLSVYHKENNLNCILNVYCSKFSYDSLDSKYNNTNLFYVPFKANGIHSIFYDIFSIISAVKNKSDVILLLGVSGALVLPFVKLFSNCKIIVNPDGIEWKRRKWNLFAKFFLRFSEYIAIKSAHIIISDNVGIKNYIREVYKKESIYVAYGGDHAISAYNKKPSLNASNYALSICRIEPENNIDLILESFKHKADLTLIFIGNWDNSEYGKNLRLKYKDFSNINLLDPIYDTDTLYSYRKNASLYIHGHSAGGTNPSLVEMMFFSTPIIAYDCCFNRYTTKESCLYFQDFESLLLLLNELKSLDLALVGKKMYTIACEEYKWDNVAKQYFDLLC